MSFVSECLCVICHNSMEIHDNGTRIKSKEFWRGGRRRSAEDIWGNISSVYSFSVVKKKKTRSSKSFVIEGSSDEYRFLTEEKVQGTTMPNSILTKQELEWETGHKIWFQYSYDDIERKCDLVWKNLSYEGRRPTR